MSMNLQEAFAAAKAWHTGAADKRQETIAVLRNAVRDLQVCAEKAGSYEEADIKAAFRAAHEMVECWYDSGPARSEANAAAHHVGILRRLVKETK